MTLAALTKSRSTVDAKLDPPVQASEDSETLGVADDPEPPSGSGRRGKGGPIKITVNLLRSAVRALDDAVGLTGDSRTDTINRAVQLYAFYQKRISEGDTVVLIAPDGTQREVHLF